MWCFQKFGFEADILAELQRQQQCSQFCNTLLKAEATMVPVHSLVLSALTSPSYKLPPPTGQSCVLELSSLSSSTLLRIVRLLYTGRMTGEGEKEKQEAISAAVKLGIKGLVEVTWDRAEGGCQQIDVGVQAVAGVPLEEERSHRCRCEKKNGRDTTLTSMKKDSWTQTEEPQGHTGPLFNMSSTQTDDQPVPAPLPYVPVPFIYTQDLLQTTSTSDDPGFDITGYPTSFQGLLCQESPVCADAQKCCPPATAGRQWEEQQINQFQDNIPGFINSFLSPEMVERSHRGRGRRRRGPTRPGTGSRTAWRPKTDKAFESLTKTVDVQNVGVSRQHKKFQRRWGATVSQRGLGGGAVGGKMCLLTRERLNPTETCRKRRALRKVWEFDSNGQIRLVSENAGRTRREKKIEQSHVESASSHSSHVTDSSSLHPCQSSFTLPAQALLHTTQLPPLEVQQEYLLDEVMLSLDRLRPTLWRPSLKLSSTVTAEIDSSGEYLNVSSAVEREASRSEVENCDAPVLQQGQEELAEYLENIIQTYEQHCQSLAAAEDHISDGTSGSNVMTQGKDLPSQDLQQHPQNQISDGTNAVTTSRSEVEPVKDGETTRTKTSSGGVVRASHLTALQKTLRRETIKYYQDEKLMKCPVVVLESQKFTEDQNFLKTLFPKKQRQASRRQRKKRLHSTSQARPASLTHCEPAPTNRKRHRPSKTGGRPKEKRRSEVENLGLDEGKLWLMDEMSSGKTYPIRSKLKGWMSVLKPDQQLPNEAMEDKDNQSSSRLCSPSGILKRNNLLQKKTGAKRRADSEEVMNEGSRAKKAYFPASEAVELKPVAVMANKGSISEAAREDVDVVGGSCPSPEVVTIDWDESSESEEGCEVIDVIAL